MSAPLHLSNTGRGPVRATSRVVPPYLYACIWNIAVHGPLTAQEIAGDHNRPLNVRKSEEWSSQQAANRLRSLIKLGLLERDEDGFYLLTATGRTWITTGAES